MKALRDWRVAKQYGMKIAADAVGVDHVTWWRWETDKVLIPPDRFDVIERVTKIPREKLRPDIFRSAIRGTGK